MAFEMVWIKYFNQKNYFLVAVIDISSEIMVFYVDENASKFLTDQKYCK